MPDTTELPRRYRGGDDLPRVGDIISCEQFANGAWNRVTVDGPKGVIEINSKATIRGMHLTGRDLLVVVARTQNPDHPHSLEFDMTCNDPSRGEARYVVIMAHMTGGHTDPCAHYPDGWRVTARRLTQEGAIDMGAPVIEFYNEPMRWYENYVPPIEISYHGTMPVPPEAARNIR